MKMSPFAGKPAEASMLVNVPKLITAYYVETPDPAVPEQRVAFGTSGHRGSAFETSFNEWHNLAVSQAYEILLAATTCMRIGFVALAMAAVSFVVTRKSSVPT